MANKETQASQQYISCVLSEDGDDLFVIDYNKDLTIKALKDTIRQERLDKLDHLTSNRLKLHLISLGDDGTLDDVEGRRNVPEGSTKMRVPTKTLQHYIGDKSLDKLYVFVEFQPPAPPPPLLIKVFCWVEGDKSAFSIKINSDETIDELKKAILKEKRSLSNLDVDQLQLFKANIPDAEPGSILFDFNNKKQLLGSDKPWIKFKVVFKGGHIHIAIKKPTTASFSGQGTKISIETLLNELSYRNPHPLVNTKGKRDWRFQRSKELLQSIYGPLCEHFREYSYHDKKEVPIYTFTSAPGCGKSRNAEEFVQSCLQSIEENNPGFPSNTDSDIMSLHERLSNARIFHVSFENGTPLTSEDIGYGAKNAIAVRMLQQLLPKPMLPLDQIRREYHIPIILEILGALAKNEGFEDWQKSSWTPVIIIDGLYQLKMRGSDQLLSDALAALGEVTLYNAFVPVCVTTVTFTPLYEYNKMSGQRLLDLPVASLDPPTRMNDGTPVFSATHSLTEQIISDCGGQGRALEAVYDFLLKSDGNDGNLPLSFNTVSGNADNIMRKSLDGILDGQIAKYGSSVTQFSEKELSSILRDIIGRKKLYNTSQISGTNLSVDEVCIRGLVDFHRSKCNTFGYLTAPYIWVAMMLRTLQTSSTNECSDFLRELCLFDYQKNDAVRRGSSTSNEGATWQAFEIFIVQFRALKSTLFDEDEEISIREFHSGAVIQGDKKFTNHHLKVETLGYQASTKSTDKVFPINMCYQNGSNAPSGDLVITLESKVMVDGNMTVERFNEVGQCKLFRKNTPFTQSRYVQEKEKSAVSGIDFFMLYTTRKIDGKIELRNLEGYVDGENWDNYFGPFAGRAYKLYGSS